MGYPLLAGFTRAQLRPDPSEKDWYNLVISNPVYVAYEGGPAVGTVLPHARGGPAQDVAGQCLLCLDTSAKWLAMPMNTGPGIGSYGLWKIVGNMVVVYPRREDSQHPPGNDQSFGYLLA